MQPDHSIKALLIGTGEFSFCEGATSRDDARQKGYVDFGNITAFTPDKSSKTDDHYGSYRGVRRIDKSVVTESSMTYSLKCDEWKAALVALLFGASAPAEVQMGPLNAAPTDQLNFSMSNPAVPGKWYDIHLDGKPILGLTSATVLSETEGVDFDLDLVASRIRFPLARTSPVTVTVSSREIEGGDDGAVMAMEPLKKLSRSGYGRLLVFDQDAKENVVMDHYGFSCDLSIESAAEIKGEGPSSEFTVKVKITTDPGVLNLRRNNG